MTGTPEEPPALSSLSVRPGAASDLKEPNVTSGHDRKRIRIAYPLSSLRVGGAELRALSLVERLPRDRFDVHFISLLGAGPLDERGYAAGAHVHYVGDGALSASSLPVRAVGRAAKLARYASLARRLRFDIIDAWLYPTDVFVAMGRQATRTPIVITGRADLLPRRAFGPSSGRIDRMVNRRVDAIVANSDAVAAANMGQHGVEPAKLHVIRNGVEPSARISDAERRRLRAELGATDDSVLVGSVGMLRDVKRHSLLIDAFASVAPTRSDVRLAIIGEGPMRAELERQIEQLGLSSQVVLHGVVIDVRPMFDAFDVVALSSRSEGMPNVLLEAAAAGKPIVTTAAGGAVEVVRDGVTGMVVPVEDQVALSSALAQIISDPELRERFGSAAGQHVAAVFGMERFVKEWCDLYEGLAVAKGLVSA